ncbi:MAG TPA: hypothetical protein DCE07_09085 [Peptococcaceae bacterium]|nr:hypothetical protein [Peptococcaceae bacterium]
MLAQKLQSIISFTDRTGSVFERFLSCYLKDICPGTILWGDVFLIFSVFFLALNRNQGES